jgi:hypothetical protein
MTYTLGPNHHADRGAAVWPMDNSTDCFGAVSGLIPVLHFAHGVIRDPDPDQCTATLNKCRCCVERGSSDAQSMTGEENGKKKVVGVARDIINVTLVMDPDAGRVTLTLSGPVDRWFGAGLGTNSMCTKMESDECLSGGPYAIIVEGEQVEECKLDYHGKG